jgi:anti-sigma regulatory factor (Ser/Thr protein kinase)
VSDELVVNAVRHARGTASIRLSFQQVPGGILIEVTDGDPRPPVPRVPSDLDGSGRGLAIVAGLSARWGWRPDGLGKTVFAVVPPEAEPAP